jgi:DNA-binding Lrp family transcriptional regulator
MKVTDLDDIDLQILTILQKDAGISNADLADKVSLSPSPCARRVRLLEEAGFITQQVTLLDNKKLGLAVNMFVQITLSRQRKKSLDTFESEIMAWPEVMECYLMTGDIDYLIRVVVPDLDGCQKFLDKLTDVEGIGHVKSSLSLKQVRYKTELPLEHIFP